MKKTFHFKNLHSVAESSGFEPEFISRLIYLMSLFISSTQTEFKSNTLKHAHYTVTKTKNSLIHPRHILRYKGVRGHAAFQCIVLLKWDEFLAVGRSKCSFCKRRAVDDLQPVHVCSLTRLATTFSFFLSEQLSRRLCVWNVNWKHLLI